MWRNMVVMEGDDGGGRRDGYFFGTAIGKLEPDGEEICGDIVHPWSIRPRWVR